VSRISGFHSRKIECLAFSPSGDQIVSVGADDRHSIAIHDVRSGGLVASAIGDSSRVLVVGWSPYSRANVIVTGGVSTLKFWTLERGALKSRNVRVAARSV
jgi:WD40 repeat protein